jgi:hypothetical protein
MKMALSGIPASDDGTEIVIDGHSVRGETQRLSLHVEEDTEDRYNRR